jgi:hypothetical protein
MTTNEMTCRQHCHHRGCPFQVPTRSRVYPLKASLLRVKATHRCFWKRLLRCPAPDHGCYYSRVCDVKTMVFTANVGLVHT